jgi:formamidopyrimidine-DNA glycosylase
VGKAVEAVERKGKWLRIELTGGGRVFSHLGMTGAWVRAPVDAPELRFERARIDVLRRGLASSVRYVDARRLGRLVAAADDIDDWKDLGPDPLGQGIGARELHERVVTSRRPVKDLLMDQRVLAGVGNILATEALWMARVDPRSPGRALLREDARAITRGIHRAIARELRDLGGRKTTHRHSFFVYGRAGEPCPRCHTPLTRTTVGGRTSVFCRRCQVRRTER